MSITTIYSAQGLLNNGASFWQKQLIWYLLGFFIAYFVMLIGNKFLYQNAWIFYIANVLLLLLVLFYGKEVNNSICWFEIPGVGSFQPSEFMKIILIIVLGRMINDYNEKYTNPTIENEFKFLIKVLIVVFIPSILTFIEPDTGAVLIYLIITFVMLFIGGIRKRWFILTIGILGLLVSSVLVTFYINQDLFIDIFGTNFFYRVERIVDWSGGSGMQLTNSLTAIGSGGMFGHGFNNTPIYFPEPQTDFIFAVFASNYGLFGAIMLIFLILFFDIRLINTVSQTSDMINKYVIGGILAMLLYQQVQNISMTIGLLPITGITLPFISYGGSSLISYMIMAGVIFNISNESLRYTN
ncbi:MAG: FtsW/RodA/SpoVE family cell cycle protein [bacterium]|nr:FtsW/RodA/SpoVE family cell cycle protein [bacterium]